MLRRCLVSYICIILLTGLEAFYLHEYEYVEEIGWLRLHKLPATWTDARVRCNVEGDILASPTKDSIKRAMTTSMSKHGLALGSVFVDILYTFSDRNFVCVDGTPLSNMSVSWAEGEPNNLSGDEDCLEMSGAGELADVSCSNVRPFFCLKRMGDTATHAVSCESNDKEYKWEPRTGSCYKFHYQARQWFPASMVCATEHAHLAVINSETEAQIIKELYSKYPTEVMVEAHYTQYAHIGFWDWTEKAQWTTVLGESLDEAGFNRWAPDEPNNPGQEICGSVTRDALLNDGYCVTRLPFICESYLTININK